MLYRLFLLLCLLGGGHALALKPIKEYSTTPANFNIPYQEQQIPSAGATINSWWLQQPDTSMHQAIIICNGDYGNMGFSMMIANEFYKKGLNVILFDYSGFGKSTGSIADTNMLYYDRFVDNLVDVMVYYQQHHHLSIRLYASSMGTIVAANAFALQPALFSGTFYFDSFIESLSYTVDYLKAAKNRPFKAPISEEAYAANLAKLKEHKVVFYRGKDDMVTHAAGIAFKAKAPLWKVIEYDGGHMQAPYILGSALFDKVGEW